ncbi:hypothetical protein B0J18DRAFT_37534 [Chaetomium sp. MPI-SDFR-AT-0129]|nr:hypothetical protein B0J18DRAFT_37534 [Chaetomium sp. MPI-SDFR-AT-0129]
MPHLAGASSNVCSGATRSRGTLTNELASVELGRRLVCEREQQSRHSPCIPVLQPDQEKQDLPPRPSTCKPLSCGHQSFPQNSPHMQRHDAPQPFPIIGVSQDLGPFDKTDIRRRRLGTPKCQVPWSRCLDRRREPEVTRTCPVVELPHKTPHREDRIRWVSPRRQEHEHPRKNASSVIKQRKGSCPSFTRDGSKERPRRMDE